jgi:hypothetical protein
MISVSDTECLARPQASLINNHEVPTVHNYQDVTRSLISAMALGQNLQWVLRHVGM